MQETGILRAITEGTTDHIYVKSREGKFLMMNSAAARFLGRKPEEVIGKKDSDFFPPEWVEKIRLHDLEIIRSGVPQTYEETVTYSGSRRTFLSMKTVIRGDKGSATGLIGISRDITDRKVMEEKLRTEHAFRKPIEDSMLAGVAAVDLEGRIIYVNPAFCKMVGWSEEELVGTSPPFVYWPSDEVERILKTVKDRLSGKGKREVEYRFQRKNGEKFHVVSLASPITDGYGKPIGYLSSFHDITDRKNAEEALRAEYSFRKSIEDSMTAGIAVVNFDGKLQYVNPAFCKMVGWSREEMIGSGIPHCFWPPEETERIRSAFRNRVENPENSEPLELTLRRKNEERIPVMVLASLLKNGKGEPAGLLGAIYDLTEKRKMEKELVKIQKLESLGVLAGGIAHDFNNILTGVMGNISLAKLRAREDGEISQNLSEAEKAIGRAAELSRQLLTFAKGGAPVKKVVALQELLANMVRFVLKGSNISTEFSIQKDLWPIECDEGQINQVIQNIVINAKQAMESGGAIRVRAVNRPMGESEIGEISLRKGDYVEISIQDQGVGIPQKNLARIFDPFFTTKEKGSGLGLAISHSVIQRHEGFIQVKSRPGQGTLFTIFLPASPNLAIRSEIGMEKLETGSGRILVMDDEESILNLLVEMLRLLGYEVETALSGSAAFESYRAARKGGKPFDLVICDLTVPGEMGGLELLGRLKKIDPEIKVIVSSGYSNDASVADYKISGFSDFIAKPYDIYRIGRTVKRVLVPDLPPAASLTAT